MLFSKPPVGRVKPARSLVVLLVGYVLTGPAVHAGGTQPAASSVAGVVRALPDRRPLAGVEVSLIEAQTGQVRAAATSGDDGGYRVEALAGRYVLRAVLPGFPEVATEPFVLGATPLRRDLDVPLTLTDTASATAATAAAPLTTSTSDRVTAQMIDVAPVKGDDFASLLPLLPGVVRGVDGRISTKGGRPAQTGLQVGQAFVNDPTTGDMAFDLPVDAIDTIEVTANPYAPESGRFSAGQATIQTRPGTDEWRAAASNFVPVPCLRICDGESLGIRAYDPRVAVSGPLVKGRLRVAQSLQFHRQLIRIPSLPDASNDFTATSLYSFTRLDGTAGAHESTATLAVYPRNVRYVNLATFVPQPATIARRQRGFAVQAEDRWRFSPVTLLETTAAYKRYDSFVSAEGDAPMVLRPSGVEGNAFNEQDRRSHTLQWVQALRTVRQRGGDHALKAGVDLLHAWFDGESVSRPVEIRGADGALRERIRFLGPSRMHQAATDVAAYAQDLWRVSDRLLFEGGLRFDSSTLAGAIWSPRAGAILGVLPEGRGILRGGIGRFADRTPLLAGAYRDVEARAVTVYSGGSPFERVYVSRAEPLSPPRAVVWNVQYDHRLGEHSALRVNHLRRQARAQLIVTPVSDTRGDALALSSTGRGRYVETEVTLRRTVSVTNQASISYVRARSEGDLNAFDVLFGNLRAPVIRANEYGRTGVDVPHRLVALFAGEFGSWRVAPLLELRSGFPWSVVDAGQQFVGPRNTRRFPRFFSLDLNVSRVVTLRGRRVRLGARGTHVLNNFVPRDVQATIDDPAFATFYNSVVPRVGLTIQMLR